MSNLDKNILITPGVGSSTDDPKIVFSAANTTANAQNITLRAYPTANGTLSVEGSAGQLFSITNQLTGTLFSVNDISGIPSIQVQDTGQIQLAPFGGYVTLNANVASNSNTTGALQVLGGVGVRGNVYADAVYSGNVLLSSAISSNVTYISGIDNAQNTRITIIEGTDVSQNARMTIIEGTDVSQNARMTIIEGVDATQNTNIANKLNLTGSLNQTVSGNVTISQDLVVAGNLIVTGNVSTQNVQQLAVADPLIILGIGNYVSDTKDIGFAAHYNDGTNAHAGLIRDAGTKEFYLFKGYTPELDSNNNVIITDPSFTTANLNASYVKANLISGGVNYLQVAGNTTGNAPTISAAGSDTNVGINLVPQGNASVNITSTGTYTTLNLGSTTNSGYYARLVSAVDATQPVSLYSGTDLLIRGGSNAVTTISSPNGGTAISYRSINQVFVPAPVGNLVNYTQLNGGGTGNSVIFSVGGSDANVAMSFLPKGTGAFNISTANGINISSGNTSVTAITRTNAGSGYTSPPTVTVSTPTTAGGVQAQVTAFLSVGGATTLSSGGTGYTAGDVLTVSGGTFTSAATITVNTVSAGVIATFTVTTGGQYSVFPSSPASVTGGTGSSATFTLNGAISSTFTITNAGSGYVEQPTVSFSGGGGSGAAAYVTVGSSTVQKTIGNIHTFATPNSNVLALVDKNSAGNYPTTSTVAFSMIPNQSAFGASYFGFGNAAYLATTSASASSAYQFATAAPSPISNGGGGSTQMQIGHTASAVNYVQVTGAATGGLPGLSSQGSDASISMSYIAKGTGYHFFYSNSAPQFSVGTMGSSVNYLQAIGPIANSSPILSAQGSSANVAINLVPKGSGAVMITGNTTSTINVANSLYVGGVVGFANSNNISVIYQSYNPSTNSLDVVFG